MERPRLTRARVIFGVATLLGLFSTFQAYQAVQFLSTEKQKASIWLLLGINTSYWYIWALLAPVVLWVARRFPFERGVWIRSLPVHLVAVAVLTIVHIGAFEAVRLWLMQAFWAEPMKQQYTWWNLVKYTYFHYFDWEMMTYWAIMSDSSFIRDENFSTNGKRLPSKSGIRPDSLLPRGS